MRGRSALALRERAWTLITRFPGFPVQLGGSGAVLAAFLTESRIRGRFQRSVQDIRGLALAMQRLPCVDHPSAHTYNHSWPL